MSTENAFIHHADADYPGWHTWELKDQAGFNAVTMGKLIVRREAGDTARLRMLATGAQHGNAMGGVHGGVTLALIDIAMFAGMYKVLEIDPGASVTLDLNCQFIGGGVLGEPLDAVTEVMKETGRLVFLRGTVEQAHGLVASFQGTVRKPARS